MIKTEIVAINNRQFLHTYSDINMKIERDGVIYDDAIDPIDSGREYIETDVLIELPEEPLK